MTDKTSEQDVMSSSEELRQSTKKATVKSITVFIGAVVLAVIGDMLASVKSGVSSLTKVLNHHACSTNGGFIALLLGVSCVGLLFATHPTLEKASRYLLRAISELSGHIVLAGLGFAVSLWSLKLDLGGAWWGFLWFISGWFCLVIAALFERRIEVNEMNKWRSVVAPWLLVGVAFLGVIVLNSLPEAVKVKPPESCEQNRH